MLYKRINKIKYDKNLMFNMRLTWEYSILNVKGGEVMEGMKVEHMEPKQVLRPCSQGQLLRLNHQNISHIVDSQGLGG